MVATPGEYEWSSYRINADGGHSDFLTPHALYQRLGPDTEARMASYRSLFQESMAPLLIVEIRSRVNSGYALGRARFQQEIAEVLGRAVSPGKPGRPRNV